MNTVARYSTSSGGEYMVAQLYDVARDVECVLLLWVEMQMTLVFEPYQPPQPPRVSCLLAPACAFVSPPWQSQGGGGPLQCALAQGGGRQRREKECATKSQSRKGELTG